MRIQGAAVTQIGARSWEELVSLLDWGGLLQGLATPANVQGFKLLQLFVSLSSPVQCECTHTCAPSP